MTLMVGIVDFLDKTNKAATFQEICRRYYQVAPQKVQIALETLVNTNKIAEVRYINSLERYRIDSVYLSLTCQVSLINVQEGIYGEIPRKPGEQ